MSRAVRAEHAIAVLAREEGLSPDAQLAIENAIDPFPDTRRPTRGWPDAGTSATITPRDKQAMYISINSNYTGLWDVYIFNASTFFDASVGMSLATQSVVSGNNTNILQLGGSGTGPTTVTGLSAYTVPSGTPFNASTWTSNPTAGYSYFNLQTSSTYLTDSMRAISCGFEIHNTTPELYRGGTIVVYRQPMNSSRYASTYGIFTTVGSIAGAISGVVQPFPPISPSAALAFCDSAQWNASKGAYLPCALQSMDLPYNINSTTCPLYYQVAPSDVRYYMPYGGIIAGVYAQQQRLWTEFSQSGAILGGLSPQTTLTVNWNVIYEIQAAGQSRLLENLASPSPPLDCKAFTMLAMLHSRLPVGVEVDRNGLGDWISSAAGAMSRALKPTAALIQPMLAKMKHPVAQMVSAAIKDHKAPNKPAKQQQQPSKRDGGALATANRQRVNRGNHNAMITPSGGNAPGVTS
jgi:hypothetical protein